MLTKTNKKIIEGGMWCGNMVEKCLAVFKINNLCIHNYSMQMQWRRLMMVRLPGMNIQTFNAI